MAVIIIQICLLNRMGLEEDFYGSAPIRNFLKFYSEHNWNKVCKATLMVGIFRLTELSMR